MRVLLRDSQRLVFGVANGLLGLTGCACCCPQFGQRRTWALPCCSARLRSQSAAGIDFGWRVYSFHYLSLSLLLLGFLLSWLELNWTLTFVLGWGQLPKHSSSSGLLVPRNAELKEAVGWSLIGYANITLASLRTEDAPSASSVGFCVIC